MWETLCRVVTKLTITDWVITGGSLVVLIYIYGTWTYDTFVKKGLASMHPKVPFMGNARMRVLFGRESLFEGVKMVYDKAEGHSVFGFFEFRKPIYMIRDPELLKFIAIKDFDHFPNHRRAITEKSDQVFAKNLFLLRDQKWRDMRATLSPAFTTNKMKIVFPLISQCGEQMVKHLRKKHVDHEKDTGSKKLSLEMKDLFSRMANDVIATSAFGVECDSFTQPENEFFRMGHLITTFNVWRGMLFILAMVLPLIIQVFKISAVNPRAKKFFQSLIMETIAERDRKNIFRPDILQLLMDARRDELKTETADAHEIEKIKANKLKLDQDDILAQGILFFFAGFETVSSTMSFITFNLSTHPDVQKRLREEIDAVMKQTNGKLSYEAVQSMKYLDMVVNESLRLYPPVSFLDRECRETTTIPATDNSPAFTVNPGDIMWFPVFGLHRDPQYWPEPERFDPERFNDENKQKITPFTNIPFGLGPRLCVGQRFALLEVKIGIIHLLSNFELHPSPKVQLPITFQAGFNTMIKGGAWCDLAPRDVQYCEEQ